LNRKSLPVFTLSDLNPGKVVSLVHNIGYKHKITPFAFINQYGKVVTNKDFEDLIYIVDFF
jgi:protein SCO1/2